MSAIRKLGRNVSREDIVLYGVIIFDGSGKTSHSRKHLHGRCVIGTFEIFFTEITPRRFNRSLISFILNKSIFLYFYPHGYFIQQIHEYKLQSKINK